MLWDEAEGVIRAHIETQWALGSFTSYSLVFENENESFDDRYMVINIEGTFAGKSIYGPSGSRISEEGGIVFFHSFGLTGVGKGELLSTCVLMSSILELKVLQNCIYLEGANPPSPVEVSRRHQGDETRLTDPLVPPVQPQGQYYRCSGSVPFILIGAR